VVELCATELLRRPQLSVRAADAALGRALLGDARAWEARAQKSLLALDRVWYSEVRRTAGRLAQAVPCPCTCIAHAHAQKNKGHGRAATQKSRITVGHGGDRNWSLNDGQIPNFHVVRVHVSTGYNRVEGNRRTSRNGRVSDPPPEIPTVTIRNFLIAVGRASRVCECTQEAEWTSRRGGSTENDPTVLQIHENVDALPRVHRLTVSPFLSACDVRVPLLKR
jgi:hypothetical protein